MQGRDIENTPTVLLLSDDASTLSAWLTQAGCEVAAARNYRDAVAHAVRQGFNLLVVDSRQAHTMDLAARTGVRILVLRERTDMELPPTASVDDVLVKPVAQGAFLRSVQSSLKQARMVNGFATSMQQQRRDFVALVQKMAAMQEAALPQRAGQSERLAKLAVGVAEQLSLPHKRQEALELAVHLQSLGTAQHAVGDLKDVFEILQYLDCPAEGPVESRILVLVDAFDAMCGPRSYRPLCTPAVALKQLTESHDERLVRALERVVTGRVTPRETAPTPMPQKRRVGLLLFLGQAALRNGDFEAAREALEACLTLLHGTPVAGRVSACEGLAMVSLLQRDVQTAATWMARAWSAAEGQSDLMHGRLHCTQGLLDAARGVSSDAFARAREIFEAAASHVDIGRTMLLESLVNAGWPQVRPDVAVAEALAYLAAHQAEYVARLEPVLFSQILREPVRAAKLEQPVVEAVAVQIRTLGRLSITCGDREVAEDAWKTRKSRSLFLYLACQDGRPVQDEKLMEMFWPEHDIDKARQNLYAAFSHVRKAFKGVVADIVVCNKGSYRINPELTCRVDVLEFERLVKAANQTAAHGHHDKAADLRAQAESLYHGAFLDGCYDEWALAVRDELEMSYQSVMTALIRYASETRQHEAVLELAARLLAVDPCAQEVHVLAMQSWLAQGRPDMAVRQYQNCHHSMITELAATPGPEVTRLYESIQIPA